MVGTARHPGLGLTRRLPTVRGRETRPASASSGPAPALVPGLRPSRAAAGRGHRRRHHHASQHLPALGPGEGEPSLEGEGVMSAPLRPARAATEHGAPPLWLPPS